MSFSKRLDNILRCTQTMRYYGALKRNEPGQAFGTGVKPLLEMPTAHIRVPGFESHLSFGSSFFCCTPWEAAGDG